MDASRNLLGHLLEGQTLVYALNDLGDGRLDALGGAGGRVCEVADVLLPAGSPLDGLGGETLLSTGHDHVEGGEDADTSGTDDEDLGGLGLGKTRDTGRHGGWMSEGLKLVAMIWGNRENEGVRNVRFVVCCLGIKGVCERQPVSWRWFKRGWKRDVVEDWRWKGMTFGWEEEEE